MSKGGMYQKRSRTTALDDEPNTSGGSFGEAGSSRVNQTDQANFRLGPCGRKNQKPFACASRLPETQALKSEPEVADSTLVPTNSKQRNQNHAEKSSSRKVMKKQVPQRIAPSKSESRGFGQVDEHDPKRWPNSVLHKMREKSKYDGIVEFPPAEELPKNVPKHWLTSDRTASLPSTSKQLEQPMTSGICDGGLGFQGRPERSFKFPTQLHGDVVEERNQEPTSSGSYSQEETVKLLRQVDEAMATSVVMSALFHKQKLDARRDKRLRALLLKDESFLQRVLNNLITADEIVQRLTASEMKDVNSSSSAAEELEGKTYVSRDEMRSCMLELKEEILRDLPTPDMFRSQIQSVIGDVLLESLVPRYEAMSVKMLEQFAAALEEGMYELLHEFLRQNLPSMLQTSGTSCDPGVVNESVHMKITKLIAEASQKLNEDIVGLVQQFSPGQIEVFQSIQSIMTNAFDKLYCMLLSQGLFRQVAPRTSNEAESEISQLIREEKLLEAYRKVLSAGDLKLLTFLCERTTPENIFSSSECRLPQADLASLISQLALQLNIDTELKLKYLLVAIPHLRDNLGEGVASALLDSLMQNAELVCGNVERNEALVSLIRMAESHKKNFTYVTSLTAGSDLPL